MAGHRREIWDYQETIAVLILIIQNDYLFCYDRIIFFFFLKLITEQTSSRWTYSRQFFRHVTTGSVDDPRGRTDGYTFLVFKKKKLYNDVKRKKKEKIRSTHVIWVYRVVNVVMPRRCTVLYRGLSIVTWEQFGTTTGTFSIGVTPLHENPLLIFFYIIH